MLEVAGLGCIRGDRVLFRGLSFTLSPGTVLQIEGRNGAGKTTLMRVLCGLSFADAGMVRWQGHDVRRRHPEFLAALSYVGHLHGIKGDLNAVENLRAARALADADGGCSPERALEQVGLDAPFDLPCRMLSAGQKRRVALARLLVSQAILWIMDEPYTGLDKTGITCINALLTEHLIAGGMAVISSHQPVTLPEVRLERLNLDERGAEGQARWRDNQGLEQGGA